MYAPAPTRGMSMILISLQRLLEANLATMNDSVDLLKAEIAKEEALLASETKSLQEMEKNAKRAEVERKRQTKNVCDERCMYWNSRSSLSPGTSGSSAAGYASSHRGSCVV